MLNKLREGLRSVRSKVIAQWRRLTGDSVMRRRTIGVACAILLLLVASGLVFAAMAPASAPKQQAVARAQPTATETATATPTVTPTATATPKPKPKSTPKPVAKTPPPPPVPVAPATPPPTSGSDAIFSQFCSTPTPTPPTPTATATNTPTATATSAATATATTPSGTATSTTAIGYTGGHAGLAMPASCVTCPYTAGNNPSQSQIASALASAAATYNLPVNLLKAVAWQESKWHEDVYSCDGGIGLMQIQYYIYNWLNQESTPSCPTINATNYDPYTLQGNADLGAKYLAYLACYYSYWGGYTWDSNGNLHTLTNPSKWTAAWYYQQAGLPYPDSSLSNSLCASTFTSNFYSFNYANLPATTQNIWSCPYSATAGDNSVLDMVVSAYNAGPGVTDNGINNSWYISGVYGYVPQFANGSLPVPS